MTDRHSGTSCRMDRAVKACSGRSCSCDSGESVTHAVSAHVIAAGHVNYSASARPRVMQPIKNSTTVRVRSQCRISDHKISGPASRCYQRVAGG